MSNSIRDGRVDPQELEDSLGLRERAVEKGRARVHEQARAREARSLCREDSALLNRLYTAGVAVSELASQLDRWAEDFLASARIRQDAANGSVRFLAEFDDRRLLLATIDLAFVATSLGRNDIAATVLTHPAVEAVDCPVFDALAVIHGITRPASEGDVLDGAYDPWLEVGHAALDERQSAFESLVRGWRAHGEAVRSLPRVDKYFIGAWAFEAVLLAQVFGLDDGPVREVPEYPSDLADFARDAGLPRLGDDVRLPGPWKKPVPPKVIEPEEAREPIAVSGAISRADVAALLTPVGGDTLDASTDEVLIGAAVEAGTVLVIDWHGVDPADTAGQLQFAGKKLGIPVPGRVTGKAVMPLVKGVLKFDEWLKATGARLVVFEQDSDDLLVAPVLAADYETFADQDGGGLRLLSAERFAASQA